MAVFLLTTLLPPSTRRLIVHAPPGHDTVRRRRPAAALLFIGIAGTAGLISGCTSPQNSISTTASSATTSSSHPASSTSSAVSTPGKTDWGEVLGNWWKRYNSPIARPTPVAVHHAAFQLEAVTSNHPALQLLAALQQGGNTLPDVMATGDGAFLNSSIPLPHLLPGSRRRADDLSNLLPGPAGLPSGIDRSSLGSSARSVTVARLGELQNEARLREVSALDDFFNGVADYQQGVRSERETSLRAAIEDEIAVSRTSLLAQLSPLLPSEAVLLEMTNLRLLLLPNVSAPEAEKVKAQQRLDFLEMQWAALLREQENERLEELRRLVEERPRRLREEGETEIRRILTDLQTRDKNLRVAARDEQRERVAIDFDGADDRLGIVQPAFTPARSAGRGITGQGGQDNGRTFDDSATSLNRLSLPGFSPIPLPEGATAAERATFNAQMERVRRLMQTDAGSWRKVVRNRDRAYRNRISVPRPTQNRIDKQSG